VGGGGGVVQSWDTSKCRYCKGVITITQAQGFKVKHTIGRILI
jgi:hypothetical protein